MRTREHSHNLLTRIWSLAAFVAPKALVAFVALALWLAPIGQAQTVPITAQRGRNGILQNRPIGTATLSYDISLPSETTSITFYIRNLSTSLNLTYNVVFVIVPPDDIQFPLANPGSSLSCTKFPGSGSSVTSFTFTAQVLTFQPSVADIYSCPVSLTQKIQIQLTATANATVPVNAEIIVSSGVPSITPQLISASTLSSSTNSGTVSEKGARWSVLSVPATGSQATASKAAGAAGVRHVADCVSYSAAAAVAPAATTLVVSLRDGASGAGTVLWTTVVVAPATSATHVNFNFCGLNLIGSSATAMTLEFNNPLASENESVTLTGYDVQ